MKHKNSGDRAAEFFQNVWNHAADEFQSSFDDRRHLNAKEIALLDAITAAFIKGKPEAQISSIVRKFLLEEPARIEVLLQICGLTRNKILQDIKASAGEERRNLKLSNHLGLAVHLKTWQHASPYLVSRLKKVLYQPKIGETTHVTYEALNQATWPGYIRQERAKRSGHEAEYRIATLLSNCGIPFQPEEKADNPLCRDAQWNNVSFDIVVPSASAPLVCVKSTVHTANIGQYGESKDHLEIDEARRAIDSASGKIKPTLVGFIDGIGFESNRAGLSGVLEKSDEFCQFKTIWKLVVISCARLGKKCDLWLDASAAKQHKSFLNRYSSAISIKSGKVPAAAVEAGNAKLLVR